MDDIIKPATTGYWRLALCRQWAVNGRRTPPFRGCPSVCKPKRPKRLFVLFRIELDGDGAVGDGMYLVPNLPLNISRRLRCPTLLTCGAVGSEVDHVNARHLGDINKRVMCDRTRLGGRYRIKRSQIRKWHKDAPDVACASRSQRPCYRSPQCF